MVYGISQFAYLVASACFIFALHWMNTPATARNGIYAGIAGTTIAILVTWAEPGVGHHLWIILAIAAGVDMALRCFFSGDGCGDRASCERFPETGRPG